MMLAVAFDTLKLAQRLRDEVKFPPEQAEKAASVLADTFTDWQASINLATRDDIDRLDRRMREDIDRLDKRITETTQRLEERIESRIAEKFSETIKWVVGMGVAQTGFIIGVLKLHS
jgi:predicted  nucleic acid-binding Zn-ribbon protein